MFILTSLLRYAAAFIVALTVMLAAAFFNRFSIISYAYSPVISARTTFEPRCALTWSDVMPPCNLTLALLESRLGMAHKAETSYILLDPNFEVVAPPSRFDHCANRTVLHVGNHRTARLLSDYRDYFRPLFFDASYAESFWLGLAVGDSVVVCESSDHGLERHWIRSPHGPIQLVRLWISTDYAPSAH